MLDILPKDVVDDLRNRYRAGVAAAHENFDMSAADEDSLTGALGQAISSPRTKVYESEGGIYVVSVEYMKIRGRGTGAREKIYGADGIFQISVTSNDSGIPWRKGLPFQSKKRWRGRNAELARQCEDMITTLGAGIAVDFAEQGYTACSAQSVVEAGGSMTKITELGHIKPLGKVLAEDFLNCDIGRVGLYYDGYSEHFSVDHVISTDIIRVGRRK